MRNDTDDITVMLESLGLSEASLRWQEISSGPEFSDYTAAQLLREVIEPQYVETMNTRYRTNLRLSRLIDKNAQIENLVSDPRRKYNDEVVQQLRSFRFVEDRLNVGIYGVTEAGKSYFMSAFCKEACRKNYRCLYADYCDLLDELLVLSRREDLDKYRKKLRYYSRMRRLFEKSPELKDTTFCGRTLIAKVDSQIIVKMTMVSTEKDNHLNAVSCVIMNRYGPLDRHLFRFSELVGGERGRKLAVAEYDVGGDDAGGVYLPDPFTFEDISAISVPILGYVSKFYSAYYDEKYRTGDTGDRKEGNG